ncbi:hypothetical protein [uncultured Mucilaginibacter sp.]|uniref:hypothetical protein n=1 Tax=uncultured Mucilaginibacter sp. TaxID=797541 RepID=UPI0025EF0721|nr:hypothetical protein [uncultured Mucilaginibacter sp.]
METMIINVPETKSTLVKQLLKELGVEIQGQDRATQLAKEISAAIKPGKKPTMDEIVAEVRAVRSKK